MNIINNKDGIDWNRKYIISFSFIFSDSIVRINLIVLISIINHKIVHCLEVDLIIVVRIKRVIGVVWEVCIIKKITLSVNYEPTSFISLSYFAGKNCKFLVLL